jgi:hypothetical protein
MARPLEAAVAPHVGTRQLPATAALAALGVVYGDIGTSALYGFKQAADAAGSVAPETTMGVVSVILWSLILIVALEYAILIMRADNRGEGGIVAPLALLDVRHAPPGSLRASLRRARAYRSPSPIICGTTAFCTNAFCWYRPSAPMRRASIRPSAYRSPRWAPASPGSPCASG